MKYNQLKSFQLTSSVNTYNNSILGVLGEPGTWIFDKFGLDPWTYLHQYIYFHLAIDQLTLISPSTNQEKINCLDIPPATGPQSTDNILNKLQVLYDETINEVNFLYVGHGYYQEGVTDPSLVINLENKIFWILPI